MYPHRIRLRGPWHYEAVSRIDEQRELPPPGQMKMPCRWKDGGLAGFAGVVRCTRRFGYPGRIDEFERVWLTLTGLSDKAEVSLNGESLGQCAETDCPWEAEVTHLLQSRNELCVVLESVSDSGGLWGEAALEIRRTAFLRNLKASLQQSAQGWQVKAKGELVGHSNRPLDLYLLVDGKTMAYASVQSDASRTSFELLSDAIETSKNQQPITSIRVELIDGGVIWHAVELSPTELNELDL